MSVVSSSKRNARPSAYKYRGGCLLRPINSSSCSILAVPRCANFINTISLAHLYCQRSIQSRPATLSRPVNNHGPHRLGRRWECNFGGLGKVGGQHELNSRYDGQHGLNSRYDKPQSESDPIQPSTEAVQPGFQFGELELSSGCPS